MTMVNHQLSRKAQHHCIPPGVLALVTFPATSMLLIAEAGSDTDAGGLFFNPSPEGLAVLNRTGLARMSLCQACDNSVIEKWVEKIELPVERSSNIESSCAY